MKKLFTCLLLVAVLVAGLGVMAFADDTAPAAITVTVDGTAVVFTDATPFIDENGRTLVPLRAIADAIGMVVEWEEVTRVATFTKTYTEDTTRATDATYGYLAKEVVEFTIGAKSAVYTEVWMPATVKEETPADDTTTDDATDDSTKEDATKEDTTKDDSTKDDATTDDTTDDATTDDTAKDDATADDTTDDATTDDGEIKPTKEESTTIAMDTEAIISESRTFAPVRYLAAQVGYTVDWDATTRTVILVTEAVDDAADDSTATDDNVADDTTTDDTTTDDTTDDTSTDETSTDDK